MAKTAARLLHLAVARSLCRTLAVICDGLQRSALAVIDELCSDGLALFGFAVGTGLAMIGSQTDRLCVAVDCSDRLPLMGSGRFRNDRLRSDDGLRRSDGASQRLCKADVR